MKKIIRICIFVIGIVFLCTGCDGNVTRDIRHTGYTLNGDSFKCENFSFKNEATGEMVNKIRYLTSTHIIGEDGKVFEISLSKKYLDGQNCYDIGSKVYVQALFDNNVAKSVDNKYYYLVGQNNAPSYSAVPTTDNSYNIYNLLLKDNDVLKVITADSSKGLYYVLKKDGNVYGYTVSNSDRNSPPKITSTQIVYNKSDYYGPIIDFNYEGNSLNTFVKTQDRIFRLKMTNGKDCTQYAGVECEFQMEEDAMLYKHYKRIIAYNGAMLITDYGKVFSVSS